MALQAAAFATITPRGHRRRLHLVQHRPPARHGGRRSGPDHGGQCGGPHPEGHRAGGDTAPGGLPRRAGHRPASSRRSRPASRSWWTTARPPRPCAAPSQIAATPRPPPTLQAGGKYPAAAGQATVRESTVLAEPAAVRLQDHLIGRSRGWLAKPRLSGQIPATRYPTGGWTSAGTGA